MVTKPYINYFDELKGVSASEQEVLLEKARHEAFAVQKLAGKSALHLVFTFIISFLIATGPIIAIDSPESLNWFNGLFVGMGCIWALYYYRFQYGKLIHKGLVVILEQEKSNEGIST